MTSMQKARNVAVVSTWRLSDRSSQGRQERFKPAVNGGDTLTRVRQEYFTHPRNSDSPTIPFEKLDPQMAFQFSDRPGDGRLGNSQDFRSAPDAALASYLDEGVEVAELNPLIPELPIFHGWSTHCLSRANG